MTKGALFRMWRKHLGLYRAVVNYARLFIRTLPVYSIFKALSGVIVSGVLVVGLLASLEYSTAIVITNKQGEQTKLHCKDETIPVTDCASADLRLTR